ncbi:MAG: chloride channel protein [Bacteroidetes bacterium]|nr:chloride channel protein [Bacteroidota bacterium]
MNFFSDLRKLLRFYRFKINRLFSIITFSQDSYLLILGGITGVLCGIGAVIFHYSIELMKELFFDLPAGFFGRESLIGGDNWINMGILILIPAIGGLLVGLVAKHFEKSPPIEGIPSVIDSVASKGGIIKGRVAVVKTILNALSIGTGGAGGKEGPIVQIGASIGSAFGQYLSSSPDRLKILVGCGAAAGLSAAFNTPLGGALFATEIIMRTFNARTFSPIIIASVFGTVLSRSFIGAEPALRVPDYALTSNYEFFLYTALGILAGFASIYFIKSFFFIEGKFVRMKKMPVYLKPAIGGLFVGLIGLFLPGVYGFSYALIDRSLFNQAPFIMLVLLFFFKPIATGFTIGSGGNGGTFAPSLFTGAMLGGAFGQIVNYLFPEISAPAGAYALVGMAAVVAGVVHAPLTALIMVFEMTNNYTIILPLMLTIIISMVVSKSISKGSLYTIKFEKEGKVLDIFGRKIRILKNIKVSELIEKDIDVVYDYYNFNQIIDVFKKSKLNSILVKDNTGKLIGQIFFQDIRDVILEEETRDITSFIIARDFMTNIVASVSAQENCEEALSIMENYDLDGLPVLIAQSGELIGIISKDTILSRYQKEILIQPNEASLGVD